MEIQYDNPNEVGMTGLLGMPSGYYSMHEAEVLVLLGTDFPYEHSCQRATRSYRWISIRIVWGVVPRYNWGLCGDVKDTLDELIPLIHQKEDDSFLREQLAKYEKVRENLRSAAACPGERREEYSQST